MCPNFSSFQQSATKQVTFQPNIERSFVSATPPSPTTPPSPAILPVPPQQSPSQYTAQYYPQGYDRYLQDVSLCCTKAQVDLAKATAKSNINMQETKQLLRMREDVKLEASFLEEGFSISDNGSIVRTQKFLSLPEKKYSVANFRITSRPKLLQTSSLEASLLWIQLNVRDDIRELVLDLNQEKAVYFAKKFRQIGTHLKLKRGETNELYLRFVAFLRDQADALFVPPYRGFFYHDVSDSYLYIDVNDKIWEDFKNAAK